MYFVLKLNVMSCNSVDSRDKIASIRRWAPSPEGGGGHMPPPPPRIAPFRAISNTLLHVFVVYLFKDSKVLKFDDLFKLEVGKFMYDGIHNTLPKPLSAFHTPNSVIHSHDARQSYNPHVQPRRSVVANNSLLHKAPAIWNNFPQTIMEMSIRSKFKRALKRKILATC